MKKLINKVSNELKDELLLYDSCLKDSLNSDVKLINTVIKYIMKIKGKQFRPILCILASKLIGEPNKNTYISASTVEMLHVATLLHDDVVDDANIRRGWPTTNSIWRSKVSILIGDYMFSRSLNNIVKLNSLECLNILGNVSDRLSKGEIFQIENSINKNMSEENYFKMISDKTASLISASCKLGILSVKDCDAKNNLSRFGECLGIAYQLKDDLFDVIGNIKETGKPSNLDVKKNMLTLPYIHVINSMPQQNRKKIISKIKYHLKKKNLRDLKNIILQSGGVEYTNQKIIEYSNKAKKELSLFQHSKYKDLLIDMLEFNLSRHF